MQGPKPSIILSISNLVGYIFFVTVSGLFLKGSYGSTFFDVSDKFDTPLTPPRYALLIWVPILLLQGLSIVTQLLFLLYPGFYATLGLKASAASTAVLKVGYLWQLGWLVASAWQFSFASQTLLGSISCSILLVVATAALTASTLRLDPDPLDLITRSTQKDAERETCGTGGFCSSPLFAFAGSTDAVSETTPLTKQIAFGQHVEGKGKSKQRASSVTPFASPLALAPPPSADSGGCPISLSRRGSDHIKIATYTISPTKAVDTSNGSASAASVDELASLIPKDRDETGKAAIVRGATCSSNTPAKGVAHVAFAASTIAQPQPTTRPQSNEKKKLAAAASGLVVSVAPLSDGADAARPNSDPFVAPATAAPRIDSVTTVATERLSDTDTSQIQLRINGEAVRIYSYLRRRRGEDFLCYALVALPSSLLAAWLFVATCLSFLIVFRAAGASFVSLKAPAAVLVLAPTAVGVWRMLHTADAAYGLSLAWSLLTVAMAHTTPKPVKAVCAMCICLLLVTMLLTYTRRNHQQFLTLHRLLHARDLFGMQQWNQVHHQQQQQQQKQQQAVAHRGLGTSPSASLPLLSLQGTSSMSLSAMGDEPSCSGAKESFLPVLLATVRTPPVADSNKNTSGSTNAPESEGTHRLMEDVVAPAALDDFVVVAPLSPREREQLNLQSAANQQPNGQPQQQQHVRKSGGPGARPPAPTGSSGVPAVPGPVAESLESDRSAASSPDSDCDMESSPRDCTVLYIPIASASTLSPSAARGDGESETHLRNIGGGCVSLEKGGPGVRVRGSAAAVSFRSLGLHPHIGIVEEGNGETRGQEGSGSGRTEESLELRSGLLGGVGIRATVMAAVAAMTAGERGIGKGEKWAATRQRQRQRPVASPV